MGPDHIVEREMVHLGDEGNSSDLWKLRFIHADIVAMRGHVEDALKYLESRAAPDEGNTESHCALKMHRGSFFGSLGRYEASHRLLGEAEVLARASDLLDLLGETYLRHSFVFFVQKDYRTSNQMFRSVLEISEKLEGWYFRGHALWGISKNLMIQERQQEAIPWLEDSLGVFQTAGARLAIAMVWSELAVLTGTQRRRESDGTVPQN